MGHEIKTRFENLDGLRFLGAFMVFLFHVFSLTDQIWGDFYNKGFFKYLNKLMLKGHHGVGLFFVLSGFLIVFLLLSEVKKKGQVHVGHFFIRRILRIWPLYFIMIFYCFFIFPYLPYGQHTLHDIEFYLMFLPNIDEIRVGTLDSLNFLTVIWSIGVEEQFYLFLMFLLLVLPFFRKGKFWQFYFLLVIFLSLVFRYFQIGQERILYYHTFSVMSDLCLGALLAWLVFNEKVPGFLIQLKAPYILVIYVLGVLMIFGSNKIFSGYFQVFERIFIGGFFAFVIWEQAFSKYSFFKMDQLKFFRTSGNLTYGFYLFHCVVIYYCSILFQNLNWTYNSFWFLTFATLVFSITYILSFLSSHYFEKYFLGLKKFFR